MRLTPAALLAAALAFASPAAACNFFTCPNEVLHDDNYPAGELHLRPNVHAMVKARDGRGLSLSGFYNDPSVALARGSYDYAPPPAYIEAPHAVIEPGFAPAPIEEGWDRRHSGAQIIMSPFGHTADAQCSRRADAHGLHGYARRDFRAACKSRFASAQ